MQSPVYRPHTCLSPQGSDHLPEGRRQHLGASLAGGEHLSHLLRGGPVPEAGTVQEGADALGKERGTHTTGAAPLFPGCFLSGFPGNISTEKL